MTEIRTFPNPSEPIRTSLNPSEPLRTSQNPSEPVVPMPAALRARVAADYAPVRPLAAPLVRAMWVLPLMALSLLAAPLVFDLRPDAARLGWSGTWGVSTAQAAVGLALVVAALREAVPGRGWSSRAATVWLVVPIVMVVAVTLTVWSASPIRLVNGWWIVGAMCFAGSASSALPVVALASILAARAYPTRPALAGALLGLGAGLVADAGWRLFCHFSQPSHVLMAHLGGVIVAAAAGAVLSSSLARRSR